MGTPNNTPTPTIEQIKAAYAAAKTDESKNILRALYGDAVEEQENRPITERVKTLEDAISILGDNHPYVKQLILYEEELNGNEEQMDDISAFLKLRLITAALNEGWKPEFTENEYRWYPWFYLYTQEEVDEMTEERKKEIGLVLWGGHANGGSCCGLGYAYSYAAFSYSAADSGSRLAFKSKELAEYAGRQFSKIYADFLI